jgi:NAD(P)-dependent dehydrogenase (short-subunit alcohol dehydrogenase family)
LSVLSGNDAAAVRTREIVMGKDLAKMEEVNKTVEKRLDTQREATIEQIQTILASGNAVAAWALYKKMSVPLGELNLSAAQYFELGKGLLGAKQYDDCIEAWLAYLKLETQPAVKVRLKLAQILVEKVNRPATALEVLQGISTGSLPADLEQSSAYAASKAGLVSLTRSLARGLGPEVRVNAVAPGSVNSPWQKDWPAERKQEAVDHAVLKRHCEPEDIAEVIFFLCAGGRMITGETIVVDGGLTL